MDEMRGILSSISANQTDAGGPLTEDELLNTMSALYAKEPPGQRRIITSPRVVERGRGDAKRAENAADAAKMELYRLRQGWRRHFRFRARRRAAERYLDARTAADALRATFGY